MIAAINKPLTAREVATQCHVAISTVNNWINLGVRGVFLAARKLGGCYRIEPDALAEFIAACNADEPAARPRTPAQDRRQAERDVAAYKAATKRKD